MALSDSQTGTPVTLVVPPAASGPGTVTPPPGRHGHVPFTGFDLPLAVLLAVLLLVLGSALLGAARRLPPRLVPARLSSTPSRRKT